MAKRPSELPDINTPTADLSGINQPYQQPIHIQHDVIGDQVNYDIANTVKSITDNLKKVAEYNITTKFMSGLEQINQSAIQNKWTPDEYEKQLSNFMQQYQVNDPKLSAYLQRYTDLEKVRVSGQLFKIQTQQQMAEALANTDNFINQLNATINPNDPDSYQSAFVKAKTRIDMLTANGILNPYKAQRLLDQVKSKFSNTFLVASLEKDPETFLNNINKGAYDSVIPDSAVKQRLITQAKRSIKQNQLLAKQQQQEINAQLTYKWMKNIIEGNATFEDVAKSNLPDQVKARLLSFAQSQMSRNPKSAFVYGDFMNDIVNGKYDSLDDLQNDLNQYTQKGLLNSSQIINLQNMFLRYKGIKSQSLTGNVKLDSISTKYFNSINSMVNDKINALQQHIAILNQGQYTQYAALGLKPPSPVDANQTSLRAKTIWLNLYSQHCQEGCSPNMLEQITNMSVFKAMYKPEFKLVEQYNQELFNNIQQYVGTNNIDKIKKTIIDSIVMNNKLNINNDLTIGDILKNVYHNQEVDIPLTITIKKNGSKVKLPLYLHYDGQGNVIVSPKNKSIWR